MVDVLVMTGYLGNVQWLVVPISFSHWELRYSIVGLRRGSLVHGSTWPRVILVTHNHNHFVVLVGSALVAARNVFKSA